MTNRVYIRQQGLNSIDGSIRSMQFYFDLTESIDVKHNWENISKTATVILPRRIQTLFYSGDTKTAMQQHSNNEKINTSNIAGNLNNASDTEKIVGKSEEQYIKIIEDIAATGILTGDPINQVKNNINPLIQRGDVIRIDGGYEFIDEYNMPKDLTSNIYFGYVTGITIGDKDIKIECEDYTYMLKQIRLNSSYFHVVGNPISSKGAKGSYAMLNGNVDPKSSTGKKEIDKSMTEGTIREMITILSNSGMITSQTKQTYPLRFYDKKNYSVLKWLDNYKNGFISAGIDVSDNPKFWMGDWNIQNTASLYDLIEKLSSSYGLHPYFPDLTNQLDNPRGVVMPIDSIGKFNDWTNIVNYKLNLGTDVYNPAIRPANIFTFIVQKDVISSNLEFRRKDDIIAGAYVKGWTKTLCDDKGDPVENISSDNLIVKQTPTGITFKGYRTQTKQTSITVGDLGGVMFCFIYSNQMATIPVKDKDNKVIGLMPTEQTRKDMEIFGNAQLSKYHYTGYKGSFTTFGYPFVRVGDLIYIKDTLFPERDGTYVLKGIHYSSSPEGGSRQEITIDYRVCGDPTLSENKTLLDRFTNPNYWENTYAKLK